MRRGPILYIALVGTSAFPVACGGEDFTDAAYGSLDLAPYYFDGSTPNNPTAGLPREIRPSKGWIEGLRAEYYDFGVVAEGTIRPMYFFFDSQRRPLFSRPILEPRNGQWHMRGGRNLLSPNPAADAKKLGVTYSQRIRNLLVDPDRGVVHYQRPIIDFLHNSGDYTGLWEIVEVIVPDGYEPDSIKSFATLERAVASGTFAWRRTGRAINCPVLDDRTTVIPSAMAYGLPHPRIELWYRTKLGSCFLANGWETLGDDDHRLYSAAISRKDDAPEDARRLETFRVIRSMTGKGASARLQLRAVTSAMYTPTLRPANQVPDRPPVDVHYGGDDLTNCWPRHVPSDPDCYTPLRRMQDIRVTQDPPYAAGTFRKVAEVDAALIAPRPGVGGVKNFAFIGSAIPCTPGNNAPCEPYGMECNEYPDPNLMVMEPPAGKTPADVNWEHEGGPRCDIKSVGFGEWCAPGVARCRAQISDGEEPAFRKALGGAVESSDRPTGGYGYSCFPAQGGYCYVRCNGDEPNTMVGDDARLNRKLQIYPLELAHSNPKLDQGWDTDFARDSRCGDLKMLGYACVGQTIPPAMTTGLGVAPPNKMRFCIRTCSRSALPDHVNQYRCSIFRVVKPDKPILCPDPSDPANEARASVDHCPRCPLRGENLGGARAQPCPARQTCLPRLIGGAREGRCYAEPGIACPDPADPNDPARAKVDFCSNCFLRDNACPARQHCRPMQINGVREGRCHQDLDEVMGSLQDELVEPGLALPTATATDGIAGINPQPQPINPQPGMSCTNYNNLSACMWDPVYEPRDPSVWPR